MPTEEKPSPKFFATPARFGQWLERHHARQTVLWVGYHKKGTGKPSLTWPESVREALRFGWIDGVRRSFGADRYMIRFTPRRATSNWSRINIRMAKELIAEGRMAPAGLAAFEARSRKRSGVYTYEQDGSSAEAAVERELGRDRAALAYFRSRPPWYRRTCSRWVMSAKKDETRQRRLARLIEDSAAGRAIGPLRRAGKG